MKCEHRGNPCPVTSASFLLMERKGRKRTRKSRPDDPDKDPWTLSQVTSAYNGHTNTVSQKGLNIEPATKERSGLNHAQRHGMAADFQLNADKRMKFERDITAAVKAALNELFAKEVVQDEMEGAEEKGKGKRVLYL
jgi:hypothetical protein